MIPGDVMNRNVVLPIMVTLGLVSSLLVGCGGSTKSESARISSSPTAEEVKRDTVARLEAATVALASDQHVFRFDGVSSRTFTKCEDTVCGVSATAAGVEDALQRALADSRSDFGISHFAARLRDSLELKPQTGVANGVPLVEGFGLRTGDRAFSARFYGGWLGDGAFFVNETTLTVRDGQGQPIGIATVFDSSAIGVARAMAPAAVRGMAGTWKGMMIGADVKRRRDPRPVPSRRCDARHRRFRQSERRCFFQQSPGSGDRRQAGRQDNRVMGEHSP